MLHTDTYAAHTGTHALHTLPTHITAGRHPACIRHAACSEKHSSSHAPVPAISAYTPGWMFQPGSQSRSCMPNSAPQAEPTMSEGMNRPPGMATPAPTLMRMM